MRSIIICLLGLIIHQANSADLPSLPNTAVAVFAEGSSCRPDGPIGCTDDCSGQRYCFFGKEITVNCYTQTSKNYCDRSTLQCTNSSLVKCEPINPFFNCPRVGYFPYALDCTKLWVCPQQPPVQILTCTNNMVFDALNKRCVLGASCYTFSPINGLCKDRENSMVVHPINKAIFAYCSGTFPQIDECPKNHIFNIAKLTCEFQCPGNGNFPDPNNRQCYFTCTKYSTGYRISKSCCSSGMWFDETVSTCTPPL